MQQCGAKMAFMIIDCYNVLLYFKIIYAQEMCR